MKLLKNINDIIGKTITNVIHKDKYNDELGIVVNNDEILILSTYIGADSEYEYVAIIRTVSDLDSYDLLAYGFIDQKEFDKQIELSNNGNDLL